MYVSKKRKNLDYFILYSLVVFSCIFSYLEKLELSSSLIRRTLLLDNTRYGYHSKLNKARKYPEPYLKLSKSSHKFYLN